MDDTAFHYSRTLRIIMVLAIVLPIIAIGAILWYFSAGDSADTAALEEEQAAVEHDGAEANMSEVGAFIEADEANPLQPIGPKASDRLTPGSTVCSSGCSGNCPCSD
jgi:flagellar basal body-associated protein FliL